MKKGSAKMRDEVFDPWEEIGKLKKNIDYVEKGGERFDVKEFDLKYKEIMKGAEKEAKITLKKIFSISPRDRGYRYLFWPEKKRILKEKYRLDWRSPAELNPGILYD